MMKMMLMRACIYVHIYTTIYITYTIHRYIVKSYDAHVSIHNGVNLYVNGVNL